MRRQAIRVKIAKGVSHRRSVGAPHPRVIGSRMADLRRLGGTRERNGSVDLGRSRTDSCRWSSNSTSARARRCGGLGGLRAEPVRYGATGTRGVLLERLLRLRRRRRRDRQTWRSLGHLMLRAHLLVLRGRRGRRRGQLALSTTGHDTVEETGAGGNGGGLLRRARVGRRTADAGRRVSTSSLKLTAEHGNFLFVPVQKLAVSSL